MKHIVVLAGPAGSGKTTIGKFLEFTLPPYKFIDGDDYHSAENIQKMHRGEPLEDQDRAPWLNNLSGEAVHRLERNNKRVVFVACSSLKYSHREVFRTAVANSDDPSKIKLHFIYLRMSKAKATRLVQLRQLKHGHWMSVMQVENQYMTLQEPNERDCITINANDTLKNVEWAVRKVVWKLIKPKFWGYFKEKPQCWC